MRTVMWEEEGPAVRMIDQRQLPGEMVMIDLRTVEEVSEAIRDMAVRGAPAIGATAAFGLALAGATSLAADSSSLWKDLDSASEMLLASRPTASNLKWALNRLQSRARSSEDQSPHVIRQLLLEEAQRIADEVTEFHDLQIAAQGVPGIEIGQSRSIAEACAKNALRAFLLISRQGLRKMHWDSPPKGV